ncbi:MAG: AraC family transcriptional regulator [Desulfocurvibacter africanus]
MRVTASHILDCHHARDRRDLFLEYKKVELFYFQLSLLDSHLVKLKNIGGTEMQAVHRAREILLADLTAPPGLRELAAQVGLSRSRLNTLFRTLYGDTVFGVVRKERLECARRILENGMNSVTEVAYECGFSSPSHLTKAFAECYGMCPKRYQNECSGRCVKNRKKCARHKL